MNSPNKSLNKSLKSVVWIYGTFEDSYGNTKDKFLNESCMVSFDQHFSSHIFLKLSSKR